jgi:hypothetical protein
VTRRFRCRPVDGDEHHFSVLVAPAGQTAPTWEPPPPCPEHPGGHVVRDGVYGTRTVKRRQRYRCTPPDGGKPHRFTPPLAREHVHAGHEQCDECDELRGVHHGETTVARRHSWPVSLVARGLADLAAGRSYGDTALWALRQVGREPKVAPTTAAIPAASADGDGEPARAKKKVKNPGSAAANNSWHVAADWVEALAPVIYEPVDRRLRASALAERARLDALREAGEPLERPQVLLLDDVPVYGRAYGQQRARRDDGFFILVAAEVAWGDSDPLEDAFAWCGRCRGCGWCGRWPSPTIWRGGCCSTSWATTPTSWSLTPAPASARPSRLTSTRT